MAQVSPSEGAPNPLPAQDPLAAAESSVSRLNFLLGEIDAPAKEQAGSLGHAATVNDARWGIASGLFAALRHKHAPTAAHSLRVANGCSAWARALAFESARLDELEVAALLHDIGKIGSPDRLLLKPGPLDGEELKLMDQYRVSGLDLLADCCPSTSIIDTIRHAASWYDGSRPGYELSGANIPLGSRMLAIVDAYDSMTSDQVYRRAMSSERALHELYGHAGTQFDPQLIKSFDEMRISAAWHREMDGQWLRALDPRQTHRYWQSLDSLPVATEALFQQKLLDNMHDAVVFVDRNMQILRWNRGAERLTGIVASSVVRHTWSPALMRMSNEDALPLTEDECPVAFSVTMGVQSLRRMWVVDRHKRRVVVNVHTMPVVGPDGTTYGATMILHDASSETSLEEKCQHLHERATKDPLTKIANRAEFDRAHQLFIEAHLDLRLPCSLIMCDIDHFKSVNDTYGHQAGDAVLISFGRLLRDACRPGDLVARYGGEEFAMLCADCNNAGATRRAEQLRQTVGELPQSALNGLSVTASFGVTEVQPGDSCESMLRRADRALLEAKRIGRNTVVQLGDGIGSGIDPRFSSSEPRATAAGEPLVHTLLVTDVPVPIAVEKLRGFVLDHHAEVISVRGDRIELELLSPLPAHARRQSDRQVPFIVIMTFAEQRAEISTADGRSGGRIARTRVKVQIELKRSRDRRLATLSCQADALLAAIRSYLMAQEQSEEDEPSSAWRPARVLLPPQVKSTR